MRNKSILKFPLGLGIFAIGIVAGSFLQNSDVAVAQMSDKVFELRTYTTHPGRLEALHSRFRDHTMDIFAKHGMTNIGYFTPQDEPLAENTLVYVIAHDSREAAAANWKAFVSDPEWQQVYAASREDGDIVESIENVFLDPTDYSQIK